jgi:threonyl-tRNA synthetase
LRRTKSDAQDNAMLSGDLSQQPKTKSSSFKPFKERSPGPELDASTHHIKSKIANAEQMKVHTMLVIGHRDLEANAVSVRNPRQRQPRREGARRSAGRNSIVNQRATRNMSAE